VIKLPSFCLLFLILAACNGGESTPPVEPETSPQTDATYIKEVLASAQSNLPIPNNQVVDHYQILLLGNSHSQGVGDIVERLIKARFPQKQVTTFTPVDGLFLSDRISDRTTLENLVNTPWTHVILQAQKYSASGLVSYPTDAAVSFIQLAKTQDSTPILFPEHPRFNNITEGLQVHLLHKGIAEQDLACVAPIGLTWDAMIELDRNLDMHQSDGNHANSAGKTLTSLVLYQVITGESADELPYIGSLSVNESTQNIFGQIASLSLEQNPACIF